jgi:hypothetical protein
MNLKRIQIELDVSDVQSLLAIALDDNEQEALAFIKQKLVKQAEKQLQRH